MLGLAAAAWWSTTTGCVDESLPLGGASSTALVATGAGGAAPCHGFHPDGFCAAFAASPETCECPDCAEAAVCASRCMDDGKCDFDAGEDCSCSDCFFKSTQCNPSNGGCNNNDGGVCSTSENCTCPDCTNTEYCKTHCEDNGECVPYFEGCACADCKTQQQCGGSSSSTASSSSAASASASASAGVGGGGGSGGGGGAGGS
jgi:uncharacterized membrane protein YgcG